MAGPTKPDTQPGAALRHTDNGQGEGEESLTSIGSRRPRHQFCPPGQQQLCPPAWVCLDSPTEQESRRPRWVWFVLRPHNSRAGCPGPFPKRTDCADAHLYWGNSQRGPYSRLSEHPLRPTGLVGSTAELSGTSSWD